MRGAHFAAGTECAEFGFDELLKKNVESWPAQEPAK
jgi:hypothetical protein